MIDAVALSPPAQAALLVGVVLFEAIAFYASYAAVERIVAPSVIETIANT
ncbi:DUF7512 family protein [Natrarchaeobius halalkaliphilus]|nr:hypothetical protein [Natrarchaeobius halalkaliphilus]